MKLNLSDDWRSSYKLVELVAQRWLVGLAPVSFLCKCASSIALRVLWGTGESVGLYIGAREEGQTIR